MSRRNQKGGGVIITIVLFAILAIAAVLGWQFISKTGIFHVPGELIYDDSVSTSQQEFVDGLFTASNIELAQNVNVSSLVTTEPCDDILYNIYVPVTGFYNPVGKISEEEFSALVVSQVLPAAESTDVVLIPVDMLTNRVKLLAVDESYYLDSFQRGASFEYLVLAGDEEDVVKITTLLTEALPEFPDRENVLSFIQTGVTALSRGMNKQLANVGDASFFAEYIADYLSSFDLTHTSNEASFSATANARNICANTKMIDTLTAIGLDIVELTGNHNQDCGDQDAIATIEQYQGLGIKTFGGGRTATEAAEPLLISEKGTGITLLGYNLSTGGYTLDNTPGANFYTEADAKENIAAAQARGDIVIVDVQYYECSEYDYTYEYTRCDAANSSAGDQIYGSQTAMFRHLIDLGADVVVGTSAHQTQTYELYGNGVIYYGLGNLFFDQIWWPGTTRSLMLAHYFWDGELIQTRLVGTVYDQSMRTMLMNDPTLEWFITRLNNAR